MNNTVTVNEERQECSVCHSLKNIESFSDRPDGMGKRHVCRTCEIRRLADDKARGIRRCVTCGRRTTNYRCAQCWVQVNGIFPLKARVFSETMTADGV